MSKSNPAQFTSLLRSTPVPHPLLESIACITCPARQSDICGSIDNDEIKSVAANSSRMKLKAGETLIWDGDDAKYAYVVTHGTLRASKANDDGRRQVLNFLFVGQFIGIPSDHKHHFSAEALTDAEVCRFDRRKLEELMLK